VSAFLVAKAIAANAATTRRAEPLAQGEASGKRRSASLPAARWSSSSPTPSATSPERSSAGRYLGRRHTWQAREPHPRPGLIRSRFHCVRLRSGNRARILCTK
jgi:hypothetical protein